MSSDGEGVKFFGERFAGIAANAKRAQGRIREIGRLYNDITHFTIFSQNVLLEISRLV